MLQILQVHACVVTHPTSIHQLFSIMEIETQTHKKQLVLLNYQVHTA